MNESKHIHFIGIGGIGMSGLARFFLHEGKQVSGTDTTETSLTQALQKEGVEISYEQNGNFIVQDTTDLVVYSEAVPANNPELQKAKELKIKTVNYFEALGMVANAYYLIAVSGTHGKSTTSAMLVDILEEAGYDPTAIIGTIRKKTGSNFRSGKDKYCIVEACEYKRDFLTLKPDVLIITNIEYEHVDYYKDLADVQSAFNALAKKVPKDGAVVALCDDSSIAPALEGIQAQAINYRKSLDVAKELQLPGFHNRLNAAAARAVAGFIGISQESVDTALGAFTGTKRRFEYKGEINGAAVYDEYAHHPTEITASLDAARQRHPDKKVIVVFQPHTFSRTKELLDEFAQALAKADQVILAPIYAAREQNTSGITSYELAQKIAQQNKNTLYMETLQEIEAYIRKQVSEGDIVMVTGAGDITKLAEALVRG